MSKCNLSKPHPDCYRQSLQTLRASISLPIHFNYGHFYGVSWWLNQSGITFKNVNKEHTNHMSLSNGRRRGLESSGPMKRKNHVQSWVSEPTSPSCSWEEMRAGVVWERGMPAATRESLSETLLRSRWTGLSPETGQVMMSAPWSVRERAFSRKFSLKDSICITECGERQDRGGTGHKQGEERKWSGGWNEKGKVIAKSRVRCLKNKKRSRRFGDQRTAL